MPAGPPKSIDEQIAEARQVLSDWDSHTSQIERVRRLERGTMLTPSFERAAGYYRLDALQGYEQIIHAYAMVGDASPAQKDKLNRVAGIIAGLQTDQILMGEQPDADRIRKYAGGKMQELEKNGETYLLSGHRTHFNITRISKTPDGRYTYTLYDAGHESKVLRWEGDRPVVHALQEKKINKGIDIRWLIETDVIKKSSDKDGDNYKNAKKYIEGALDRKTLRFQEEYGQRKGNCTTRGQRILLADIVKDPELTEKFYDFTSNIENGSTPEIRRMLQRNIDYLANIRQGLDFGSGHSLMQVDTVIKAFDKGNYELQIIPTDSGERIPCYRTKPGVFGQDELKTFQATLYRNGVYSAVRESIAQPGRHYLYVQPTGASQIQKALEQDESPAAQMYRKYGKNAIYHMHDLLPEGQKPMQIIGNRGLWQTAEANDGAALVRTPLQGLSEPAIQALETELRNQGFHPLRHESASLGGATLRLEAGDAIKFRQWQDSISPKPIPPAFPKPAIPQGFKIWS